jgi:hypothetical protein
MQSIERPPFAAEAGEGTTTWFLQNRMTVKATAGTTGGVSSRGPRPPTCSPC